MRTILFAIICTGLGNADTGNNVPDINHAHEPNTIYIV